MTTMTPTVSPSLPDLKAAQGFDVDFDREIACEGFCIVNGISHYRNGLCGATPVTHLQVKPCGHNRRVCFAHVQFFRRWIGGGVFECLDCGEAFDPAQYRFIPI